MKSYRNYKGHNEQNALDKNEVQNILGLRLGLSIWIANQIPPNICKANYRHFFKNINYTYIGRSIQISNLNEKDHVINYLMKENLRLKDEILKIKENNKISEPKGNY